MPKINDEYCLKLYKENKNSLLQNLKIIALDSDALFQSTYIGKVSR